jgi:histidinol-phosphate aminotransferase
MSAQDSVLIPPPHIAAIAPYQAGKPIEELAREFGLDPADIVKLASNENPLGMPESARRAITEAVAGLGRYPDPAGFDLKKALSKRYDVPQNAARDQRQHKTRVHCQSEQSNRDIFV